MLCYIKNVWPREARKRNSPLLASQGDDILSITVVDVVKCSVFFDTSIETLILIYISLWSQLKTFYVEYVLNHTLAIENYEVGYIEQPRF